jgi:hypothetical protein
MPVLPAIPAWTAWTAQVQAENPILGRRRNTADDVARVDVFEIELDGLLLEMTVDPVLEKTSDVGVKLVSRGVGGDVQIVGGYGRGRHAVKGRDGEPAKRTDRFLPPDATIPATPGNPNFLQKSRKSRIFPVRGDASGPGESGAL